MTAGQEHAMLAAGGLLLPLTTPLLVGWGAGVLAVRGLQRRQLRWSWALLAVPVAFLLCSLELRLGVIAAIATATAIRRGAREHGEAVRHGGEHARAVRDAHGPVRWALARLRSRRVRPQRLRNERLAIGSARRGDTCRVPFGASRAVHGLILGATGSGKTVTQAAIAQAYVDAGIAVIVIDPKGDDQLRTTLQQAAMRSEGGFREWSPTGPTVYNPLARGGPTEIADKALAAHRWSEPHYELATQRLLGHALATMQAVGIWPPTLARLVRHMELDRLEDLASDLGGPIGERTLSYIDGLSARAKADLAGGRDRLAVLVESELGPRLDPALGKGDVLDLRAAIENAEVLYFDLDADRYPAASKLLAAALVIDLVGLSAERQGADLAGLVLVDEFAALAAEQVCRLFARARSARLSLLLGTQSLADLRAARPGDGADTLTEQVLSNIEFAIAHRIGDPDCAERLARVAGTVPAWSTTQRVSGRAMAVAEESGTRTLEREFLVVPDQFKRLQTGEAVVLDPQATHPAQIVRIWPAHERSVER